MDLANRVFDQDKMCMVTFMPEDWWFLAPTKPKYSLKFR
jgi:hypothetical protein